MKRIVFALTGSLLTALALSVFLTWIVRRLMLAWNWLKQPAKDRWPAQATPTLGGVAIFLTFTLCSAAFGLFKNPEVSILGVISASIFCLGLIDDRRNLPALWKLLIQILAAAILAGLGLQLHLTRVAALDFALTVLWVVGITNAFNLLDNMNGLSGGIAAIVASFRAILFLLEGQVDHATLCLVFAGSITGFLFFNFPSGRIFMGDSGSLFLGFWLSGVTLIGTYPYTRSYVALLFLPVLVMIVPILDTTLVTLTRSLSGRRIMQGGTNHTSHLLVGYGFSEKEAVLLLWALSFASGVVAVSSTFFGIGRIIPIITLLFLGITVFGTYLARSEFSHTGSIESSTLTYRHLHIMAITSILVFDAILAALSYYTAYLLRYEFQLSQGTQRLFLSSVWEFVLIKLAVLFAMGVYRGWWRYFGLDDTIRASRSSIVASGVAMAYFFLVYRLEGFPRSVLFLDLFIFTFFFLGFRFSFRIMNRWAPLPMKQGNRVLIFGPDDRGELALRVILSQRMLRVVGFVANNDDSYRIRIHSVPVVGRVADLKRLVCRYKAQGIVIASSSDPETLMTLNHDCQHLGLTQYQIVLEVQEVIGPHLEEPAIKASPQTAESGPPSPYNVHKETPGGAARQ